MLKLTVMIVDDDPMSLDVTSAMFTRAGHKVLRRSSSIGTTVAIQRERPDVVLLDVNMPGLSGDRIAKLVRTSPHQGPILIFYSGIAAHELEALTRSSNAAGSIVKGEHKDVVRQVETIVIKARVGRPKEGAT